MKKRYRLVLWALLLFPLFATSQCFTAPTPPPCDGSEPSVTDNETLNSGDKKWYYGPPAVYNSLALNGGTLIVCTDLTIDKFYMETGTIYVLPGARFIVGSGIGSGIQLKGDCAIYNFGHTEILRNVTLEGGVADAAHPNLIINATPSSVFRMPSQYLVISNPDSWFVNNGSAEFWGTIQESWASPGSICAGDGSIINMSVLINKVNNGYTVPEGASCLRVRQYSQFYGVLSAESGLKVCLDMGHNSDNSCAPFGCTPNNWGASTVLTACADCAAFAVLEVRFYEERVIALSNKTHELSWKLENAAPGSKLRVLRSTDGKNFTAIDSITIQPNQSLFSTIDKAPAPGTNYYMIQYFHAASGHVASSKMAKIRSDFGSSLLVYPVPFNDYFNIQYNPDDAPDQVMLTDITGRSIRIAWYKLPQAGIIRVQILEPIAGDLYLVHVRTPRAVTSKTIFRH